MTGVGFFAATNEMIEESSEREAQRNTNAAVVATDEPTIDGVSQPRAREWIPGTESAVVGETTVTIKSVVVGQVAVIDYMDREGISEATRTSGATSSHMATLYHRGRLRLIELAHRLPEPDDAWPDVGYAGECTRERTRARASARHTQNPVRSPSDARHDAERAAYAT